MGDSYNDHQQNRSNFANQRDGSRNNYKGGRGSGNRDGGGFRIRLSDNEMKSARSIQESFNLRSTVAVLGFAVRTLGEMLEEGKLDSLVSEYKEKGHRGYNKQNQENQFFDRNNASATNKAKPNPFARPIKPDNQTAENEIGQEDLDPAEEQNQEIEQLADNTPSDNESENETSSASS